jgi:hypothetical protein
MGWLCVWNGGNKKYIKKIVRRPLGKHPLGRPRRRWENSFTVDFKR